MIETTPPQKTTNPLIYFILLIAVIPLFFGLGVGSGYLLWGKPAAVEQPETVTGQTLPSPTAQPVVRYDVSVDDDPFLGPEDAPITIIEFSDYQCPYCQKWYAETFEQLLSAYPGQIRFVYRDFPLTSIHPESVSAAAAANCANEQDRYFDFHNALFSYQYELGLAAYNQYAADLDLDLESFSQCLSEDRYSDEVMADLEYASSLGVRATPTFFINGIPLEGAYPIEYFQQIIDAELAGNGN